MQCSGFLLSWVLALGAVGPLSSAGAVARAALLEEPVEVDLMRLANVDYRPGRALPADIQALDGKTVRMIGYMAQDTTEGTSVFLLTFDQCGCNGAKVQHFVEVTLSDDVVSFSPNKIEVVGTLEVGEQEDELGFVKSIYRLRAETYES